MANGEDQLAQQQIAEAEAERERLRLENMTALGATFNSLGQGLTFGYSDEIAAGMASAFTAPFSEETFSEIYDRQVEKGMLGRANIKAGQEKDPFLLRALFMVRAWQRKEAQRKELSAEQRLVLF